MAAAADILSQSSKLSRISAFSTAKKEPPKQFKSFSYGGTPKAKINDFFAGNTENKKKEDEKLLQEDLLAKMIAKKRKEVLDRKVKLREE